MNEHMNSRTPNDIPLQDKVAFLSRPDAYADGSGTVETRESHMAWVFLTEAHAYKLKKPVRFAYLDFTTVGKRREDSEREVRLNRRLSPDVYLGTVALTCGSDGRLRLDGPGEPVDWLVKMVRLPEHRTLKAMIEADRIEERKVIAAAERLAGFFANATPAAMAPADYHRRLRAETDRSAETLAAPEHGMPQAAVRTMIGALRDVLDNSGDAIARRAPHVADGHGDLRPQHLYLLDEPQIIDCLEFNDDLRLSDPLNELALLRLECERLGDPRPAEICLERYVRRTGDREPRLLPFYICFRAAERARLALGHLEEPGERQVTKWRSRAVAYLTVGQAYADASRTGMPVRAGASCTSLSRPAKFHRKYRIYMWPTW